MKQYHKNNFLFLQADDEPLEEDELPEHLRPQPNIDFSKVINVVKILNKHLAQYIPNNYNLTLFYCWIYRSFLMI
jgi:hypothetical protein